MLNINYVIDKQKYCDRSIVIKIPMMRMMMIIIMINDDDI